MKKLNKPYRAIIKHWSKFTWAGCLLRIQIIIILSFIYSCKKFIQIDPPKDRIVSESVFKTNETATAALLNIYSQMSRQGTNITPYQFDLYSALYIDDLKSFSGASNLQQIYTDNLIPEETSTNNLWKSGYNYIYRANAVIEGCKASSTLNPGVKKQLIAEALFIRAFWHFYLVNSYGNVPVVISSDYTTNSQLKRMDTSLVYKQIIDDLIMAQSNLSDIYVGLDGLTETQERVRPNKSAATALLSRVYLYTKSYQQAEEEASKILTKDIQYHIVSVDSTFLMNNKEAIWQLMTTVPATSNTTEGAGFVLTSKPSIGSSNSSTISPSLLAAFEPNDERRLNWIGRYTDPISGIDYYFPNKYKVKSGTTVIEYSTVFRVAEQYLIRAEARAMQDNLNGAIDDLDKVRKRAGLPLIKDVDPAIGKEDLLTAILKERRVELFTEWGHRWYDLKRTGTIDEVMAGAAIEKGGSWNSNKKLWPIPPQDIQNNPNLKPQNPGYMQ